MSERPKPHPDQDDIDKIPNFLKDIRDVITEFINNDFRRLSFSLVVNNFVNEDYFNDFTNTYIPIITQHIHDAIGYIDTHRFDLDLIDAIRNCGFMRPDVDIKRKAFDFIKNMWNTIKGKSVKLALNCAEVFFEEIDTILESIGKFVPGLEALIEIKKHIKNTLSASKVALEYVS